MRNFRSRPQKHRIQIHAPPGVRAEPPVLEGTLSGQSRDSFPVRLQAGSDARPGIQLIAFDITLDGARYGEWFDMILNVNPATNAIEQ